MHHRRPALSLLLAAGLVMGALIVAMIDFQTQLIFPVHAVAPAGPLPEGGERLEVRTADGEMLRGIHIGPAASEPNGRILILGFAGNAWNAESAAELLHRLYPQTEVVAFHYRGYAPSTGSPSAEALLADAPLVYDAAVERVHPARIVAVGFSIGTGVAANLARQRKVDGLILVTPFDSLKAVAQSLYPWMPVGPFFHHEIDSAGAITGVRAPVAIIAAERDEIVSRARTDGLRSQVPNLVFDRTVRGAGHNDIYSNPDFDAAMREAQNRLKA